MKAIFSVSILLLVMVVAGCDRFCRTPDPGETPIGFEIRKAGKVVPVSELKGAKLFWIGSDGAKEYEGDRFGVEYPMRQGDLDPVDSTKPMLRSWIAANISAERNVKGFYIEYADKNVDSVYLDYQSETGKDNHCTYTNIVFKEIRYRGVKAPVDSSLLSQYQFYPVYILNK